MEQERNAELSEALWLLLTGLAYFAVAFIALRLASINPSATPIWPATGLAIAIMLWRGYRIAAAIFVAAFAVNYLTAGSLVASLAIATGNTFEAAATVWLVRALADGIRVFESPAGVGKFALISAGATTLSATIGVRSLLLVGLEGRVNAGQVWLTWWLGDFAGAVVVTPVVLLWLKAERSSLEDAIEIIATYGAAAAVGIIAFSPLISETPFREPLGFLSIAPLLWAALRLGPVPRQWQLFLQALPFGAR
jgi:integral membrane sensor domain MASE1